LGADQHDSTVGIVRALGKFGGQTGDHDGDEVILLGLRQGGDCGNSSSLGWVTLSPPPLLSRMSIPSACATQVP
jgi:hypothetical protein